MCNCSTRGETPRVHNEHRDAGGDAEGVIRRPLACPSSTSRCFRIILVVLLLICCAELPVSASDVQLMKQLQVRMQEGDDPQWADPNYDDTGWSTTYLYYVPGPDEILWLRVRIALEPKHITEGHPVGVHFAALASHEIYWDGVLIGRGGRPGKTAEEEDPGPIQTHYVVPPHLAQPGVHLIAIRTSAHHRHFEAMTGYWNLLVGDYDLIVNVGRSTTWISLISLSGLIMAGLFSIILFLAGREERSYLLLALIGFSAAALLVAESWRNLFGYSYNWHLLRLIAITALTATVHLLLLIFLIVRYPSKHATYFIAGLVISFCISLTVSAWDGKAFGMVVSGLTLSLVWNTRAVLQRRRGSLLAATGICATGLVLLWRPELFADLTQYFTINFLLLCLLAANALRIRQLRVEREEALVKSARLEIELLKRHIQPHFLLNSLTALNEWIEEEPAQASSMIQALAEEFRILSEVSSKALITVKDELRLCRTHMEIMSRRKGRQFVLSSEGTDPNALIPPALIHTLVENAITHGRTTEPVVELKLRAEQRNGRVHYIFESPAGKVEDPSTIRDGTGIRYIRARLQENYDRDWQLKYGPKGPSWITEISIPAGRHASSYEDPHY